MPDQSEHQGDGAAEPPVRRPRRRPRRATRAATGGVDQVGGRPEQTRDDLDEPSGATPADRWWQEQRPPHWE
ncbi:hypothetical protein [Luteipulveratus halotolerans]|uniref:Uncharacterized protein n=1 Tax=Luteipulveratus halotolerans TaxID=1631356 RepID=A0A0L6CJU1_9MICO|nr:hypothetical protein [Luteipulveratus halotolerans]KNX38052.1 hypothetical protein VV01_14315 [Luteipulveratus halotolerans]